MTQLLFRWCRCLRGYHRRTPASLRAPYSWGDDFVAPWAYIKKEHKTATVTFFGLFDGFPQKHKHMISSFVIGLSIIATLCPYTSKKHIFKIWYASDEDFPVQIAKWLILDEQKSIRNISIRQKVSCLFINSTLELIELEAEETRFQNGMVDEGRIQNRTESEVED